MNLVTHLGLRHFRPIVAGIIFLLWTSQGQSFFFASLLIAGSPEASTRGNAESKTFVVSVPGKEAWTDTGLEVWVGQEISFQATGRITLQVGNPDADCGPAGYNLQTVQQPLPEENLGALIGKVVISVTVTVDEETGEEKKEEVARVFFIGAEKSLEMPAAGRLFLGINENVVGDNAGEFQVRIVNKD